MSQSRGTGRGQEGIGNRASSMGAWDKFQLGWLNYDVARAGRKSEHRLHPNSADGTGKNGLIVLLPNKDVELMLGDPCDGCGERYFYSDSGDDLSNTMTRDVDGGGPLTAQVRYEIEAGFDYAFLEASDDGGDTWEPVDTNLSSGDDGRRGGHQWRQRWPVGRPHGHRAVGHRHAAVPLRDRLGLFPSRLPGRPDRPRR